LSLVAVAVFVTGVAAGTCTITGCGAGAAGAGKLIFSATSSCLLGLFFELAKNVGVVLELSMALVKVL